MRKIGFSFQASSKTIVNLEKAINAGYTHIELKWDNFTSQSEQKKIITRLQNQRNGIGVLYVSMLSFFINSFIMISP